MRFNIAVLVGVVIAALGSPAAALSDPLHPPAVVLQHLDALERIDHVADLPAAIRSGHFDAGPIREWSASHDWQMADPGAPWNATDVVVDARLSFRRLIFAACDKSLCIVHYEHGGIAHYTNVVALATHGARWSVMWHALGREKIQNLAELRSMLRNTSALGFSESCTSCSL